MPHQKGIKRVWVRGEAASTAGSVTQAKGTANRISVTLRQH